MDDHIDLLAKIKREPEEKEEVENEQELDANDESENGTNEHEIAQSELGILGSIMKSYDLLSSQSRIPGQVEFFLDDSQYSYVITVKRLETTVIIDEDEPPTNPKNIPDSKLNIKTYGRTNLSKNAEIIDVESDPKSTLEPKLNVKTYCKKNLPKAACILDVKSEIPKKNDCETTQSSITNVTDAKSEMTWTSYIEKSLNEKVSGEEILYATRSQTNQHESAPEEEPLESSQNSSAQLDPHNIVEETQHLNEFQIMENADNSTSLENNELLLEGDGKSISEDVVSNGEENLNEISDIDKEDYLDSDGSSDSESNRASLMDTLSDMLITTRLGHHDKLLYQCKICNVKTFKINQLNRHIRRKHRFKEIPEKVGFCEIVITDDTVEDKNEVPKQIEIKKSMSNNARKRERELEELLELLSNGTKTETKKEPLNDADDMFDDDYKCTFCDFKGYSQIELYRHIGLRHAHNPNDHYKKGKLRTDCVFCPFKGVNRKSLLIHLRTKHRGGKGYECLKCKYRTHHKSNFDRHVEVVHDKKRDVKCQQCGFLTTRNYLLEKHIMYKHQGIMPYKCTEPGCDYGSTSSSSCKAHMMEVHKNFKPFECTVATCDFSTSRRFVLKSHLYKEHGLGDEPSSNRNIGRDGKMMFQCPHCEHQATQRGNLQKHIRVKHLGQLKRFKCAECDFTASEKHFVKTHISEVHLGQFLYSCHLCKFKCSLKQRFQRHFSAVHLRQRPYHCNSCDYKATQPIHLQRHIEVIHKGEKPHFCIYCKFNTAHRANLRSHLKSIHRVSDEHIKEVLLSCVDMRVMKRKHCKDVQVPTGEKFDAEREVISVNESLDRITDMSVDADESSVVLVSATPQQTVNSLSDDLEALEASLVLEKIGQHSSLNFGCEENVMMEGLQTTALDQSQISKVVKPLRTKVLPTKTQSRSPARRSTTHH